MSHISNVSGQNAKFVCSLMDNKSLDVQINTRRINLSFSLITSL